MLSVLPYFMMQILQRHPAIQKHMLYWRWQENYSAPATSTNGDKAMIWITMMTMMTTIMIRTRIIRMKNNNSSGNNNNEFKSIKLTMISHNYSNNDSNNNKDGDIDDHNDNGNFGSRYRD